MEYILKLSFKDKPECARCMLCSSKGQDLRGETVMACFALGIKPKCPEEGCRSDCPLAENE